MVFGIYNGFSSTSIFDDWYIYLFNLVFTSVPLICQSVFDKDIYYKFWEVKTIGGKSYRKIATRNNLKANYAYLYESSKTGRILNIGKLVIWITEAFLIGGFFSYIGITLMGTKAIKSSGDLADIKVVGIAIYSAIIVVRYFCLK